MGKYKILTRYLDHRFFLCPFHPAVHPSINTSIYLSRILESLSGPGFVQLPHRVSGCYISSMIEWPHHWNRVGGGIFEYSYHKQEQNIWVGIRNYSGFYTNCQPFTRPSSLFIQLFAICGRQFARTTKTTSMHEDLHDHLSGADGDETRVKV